MEMTRQVEEDKTRDTEQEEKPRLAEEIQNTRQAKVLLFVHLSKIM